MNFLSSAGLDTFSSKLSSRLLSVQSQQWKLVSFGSSKSVSSKSFKSNSSSSISCMQHGTSSSAFFFTGVDEETLSVSSDKSWTPGTSFVLPWSFCCFSFLLYGWSCFTSASFASSFVGGGDGSGSVCVSASTILVLGGISTWIPQLTVSWGCTNWWLSVCILVTAIGSVSWDFSFRVLSFG